MRRHVLVALGVLVPFVALILLGFSLMKDPLPIVLPTPVVRLPPMPPPEPVPAPRPVVVVAQPVVAPVAPPPPPPPLPLSAEAKRLPVIAGVEPLVLQCFRDMTDRVREPLSVTVQFNTTLEGGYEGAVIKKASWQDPMLSACILDAFADAKFEPTGMVMRRQSYTFALGDDDGGR